MTKAPGKCILIPLLILCILLSQSGMPVQAGQALGAKYVTGNVPDLYYCTSVKTDSSQPYDVISSATIEKLGSGYRVLEGACTDGIYAYFIVWRKPTSKTPENTCKIVKVKLQDGAAPMDPVVSDPLEIDHGNDMTLDSKNDRLVVVHCLDADGAGIRDISFIDRDSLTASKKTEDVLIPDDIQTQIKTRMYNNNPKYSKDGKEIKDVPIGFDGIKYNATRDQYVILLKDTSDFLILDSDFNYVSYLKTQARFDYYNQGIDCTDDYIVMCQSRKNSSDGNILSVYKWDDGTYVKKVTLLGMRNDYEIENIFHVGNTMYASCYFNNKNTQALQYQFGYLYTFGREENVYGVNIKQTSFRIHPYDTVNLASYINVIPAGAKNRKVIFTSSNPQVAPVNSNGLVTGKQSGTATIKIRTVEGSYETSCKITVWKEIPRAPAGLKVKKNNKKRKAKITWKKVGNPTGYRVWFSKKKSFKKSKIYLIPKNNIRSFLIKKLKKGQNYYVRVQSFVRYGKDYYYSGFSKIRKVKIDKK